MFRWSGAMPTTAWFFSLGHEEWPPRSRTQRSLQHRIWPPFFIGTKIAWPTAVLSVAAALADQLLGLNTGSNSVVIAAKVVFMAGRRT